MYRAGSPAEFVGGNGESEFGQGVEQLVDGA